MGNMDYFIWLTKDAEAVNENESIDFGKFFGKVSTQSMAQGPEFLYCQKVIPEPFPKPCPFDSKNSPDTIKDQLLNFEKITKNIVFFNLLKIFIFYCFKRW